MPLIGDTGMRVISNKALTDFATLHPASADPLRTWRHIVEASHLRNFADLRRSFNSVDRVGDFYVFDIAGNRYRLIAAIHFDRQLLFIRHVFTHAQYDKWRK
ncbi:MAG TPA: type II toxin-antitoxin system HigB family toxin [Pseudomonadales bacterium]|nr:type II toxin-antitoxin system HigB family toxin [Pseudomonadales bacterium]